MADQMVEIMCANMQFQALQSRRGALLAEREGFEDRTKVTKVKADKNEPKGEKSDFKGTLDELHDTACGVDLHKNFLVAVLCVVINGKEEFYKYRCSTYTNSLRDFAAWLISHGCYHICMESTGCYWVPIYNVLAPYMAEVRIVNPKWVKAVKGEKDDTKDARWICNKYRHGETRGSYIPDIEIRDLRILTRLRKKYIQQRSADRNRLINILTRHNYKLDMVFSDIHGTSATRIITLLTSGKPYTDKQILACVDKRCKAKPEDILEACQGVEFTARTLEILKTLQDSAADKDKRIHQLNNEISHVLSSQKYKDVMYYLMTVPGINTRAAEVIIAELGIDMSVWPRHSVLCKWAGLAPGSNESAGHKYNKHIVKGGKYLKPVLVQCAWAAVKSNDPYYKLKFQAIANRQGKKRAIIAIARKMLVSIYHMLSDKNNLKKWCPKDMNEKHIPSDVSVTKAKTKLKTALAECQAVEVPLDYVIKSVAKENTSEEELIRSLLNAGYDSKRLVAALTGEVFE